MHVWEFKIFFKFPFIVLLIYFDHAWSFNLNKSMNKVGILYSTFLECVLVSFKN
jgi:hypothetical protein